MLNLLEVYKKRYKQLLIVTIVLVLLFSSVLALNKINTGEYVAKDVSLQGGTLITIHTDRDLDLQEIESGVSAELGASVSVKRIQALGSTELGYSFTIPADVDGSTALDAVKTVTGLELEGSSYTVEEVSSGLSATFWQNTLLAMAIAFVAMSIVVLIFFRLLVPSIAVILAAASDLIGTLAIMNIFGIELSIGGVAALLMIVGYSVDTDILLTTKLLRRKEAETFERVSSSVKTGLTMQLAAIVAMSVLYAVSPAEILKQIAGILIIGLMLDIVFTWIQNVGIMLWYLEYKERKAQ